MKVTKTWQEIQSKIEDWQALQDLTLCELFTAMGCADQVIAADLNNIVITIADDITVEIP
jgi:hypothetical protein